MSGSIDLLYCAKLVTAAHEGALRSIGTCCVWCTTPHSTNYGTLHLVLQTSTQLNWVAVVPVPGQKAYLVQSCHMPHLHAGWSIMVNGHVEYSWVHANAGKVSRCLQSSLQLDIIAQLQSLIELVATYRTWANSGHLGPLMESAYLVGWMVFRRLSGCGR